MWRDLTPAARVQFLWPNPCEPVDLDMPPMPAEVTSEEPLDTFWCVKQAETLLVYAPSVGLLQARPAWDVA